MKKLIAVLLPLVFTSPAFAFTTPSNTVANWARIVGVITAQNVDNPVADIHSGTFAWSTRIGRASVNLTTGAAFFDVVGLVINGTSFSGTPGPVTKVTGTLVCNPGETDAGGMSTEKVYDTAPVSLDSRGDAAFSGSIGHITSPCSNPLFLIRIAQPAGAAGLWIATGAQRSMSDHFFFPY
jgi:hypothetical protein